MLVDDEGLHGMVKKCGTKTLTAGDHVVYVEGFQAGGGVGMAVRYSGPDTGSKETLLRSGVVPSVILRRLRGLRLLHRRIQRLQRSSFSDFVN